MNKQQLEQLLFPLQSEKIFLSAKLSGIIEKYLKDNSEELFNEIQQIKSRISEINGKIEPLKKAYDALHHSYFVLFTLEMLHGISDIKSNFTYQIIMQSEIDCEIDTGKSGFNFDIPEFRDLITDLGLKLYRDYGEVRFDRVKKLK